MLIHRWSLSVGIGLVCMPKCKWKEKVATFGTNTCRFLLHIARCGTLLLPNSEEILAVILNEDAIHCHDLGKLNAHTKHFSIPTIRRCIF